MTYARICRRVAAVLVLAGCPTPGLMDGGSGGPLGGGAGGSLGGGGGSAGGGASGGEGGGGGAAGGTTVSCIEALADPFDGGTVSATSVTPIFVPFRHRADLGRSTGELFFSVDELDGGRLAGATFVGAQFAVTDGGVFELPVRLDGTGRTGSVRFRVRAVGFPAVNRAEATVECQIGTAGRLRLPDAGRLEFGPSEIDGFNIIEQQFFNEGQAPVDGWQPYGMPSFLVDAGSCGRRVFGGASCTAAAIFSPSSYATISGGFDWGGQSQSARGAPVRTRQLSVTVMGAMVNDSVSCVFPSGAVNCTTGCSSTVTFTSASQNVTCTAAAGPASVFGTWSADCTGPTCKIADGTRGGPVSVIATFVPPVQLTVVSDGGAVRPLATSSTRSCGPSCVEVPRDVLTPIDLRPGPGQRILAVDGPCRSPTGCQVKISSPTTLHVTLEGGFNAAFVTEPVSRTSGDPNAHCAAAAADAGLTGAFYAWSRANDTALATSRGWVRLDGLELADQLADLSSTPPPFHHPLYDSRGEPAVESDLWARTASGPECGVTSGSTGTIWRPRDLSSSFVAGPSTSCSSSARLLCLGAGNNRPLTRRPLDPTAVLIGTTSPTKFQGNFGGAAPAAVACAALGQGFRPVLDHPDAGHVFSLSFGERTIMDLGGRVIARRAKEIDALGLQAFVGDSMGAVGPDLRVWGQRGPSGGNCDDWADTSRMVALTVMAPAAKLWAGNSFKQPVSCSDSNALLCVRTSDGGF